MSDQRWHSCWLRSTGKRNNSSYNEIDFTLTQGIHAINVLVAVILRAPLATTLVSKSSRLNNAFFELPATLFSLYRFWRASLLAKASFFPLVFVFFAFPFNSSAFVSFFHCLPCFPSIFGSVSIFVWPFCILFVFLFYFLVRFRCGLFFIRTVRTCLPQAWHRISQSALHKIQQSKGMPIGAPQRKQAGRISKSQHVVEHFQLAVFSKPTKRS